MVSEALAGLKTKGGAAGTPKAASGGNHAAAFGTDTVMRKLKTQQQSLRSAMLIGLARDRGALAGQLKQYQEIDAALLRVKSAQAAIGEATARSTRLARQQRRELSKLAGFAMAVWTAVKGVGATIGQAAAFQDGVRNVRIGANLSAEQETQLGSAVRAAVGPTNQDSAALLAGSQQLMGGGASFDQAVSMIPQMGNVMTALRTSTEATTGAMNTLREMGAEAPESMRRGLDQLMAIGQQGKFNPAMMVQTFEEIGGIIKGSGLKGERTIGDMAAGLQLAERSMGADNARAGLASWLQGSDKDALAGALKSANIDYNGQMAALQSHGLSEYQASLELAGSLLQEKLGTKDQQALLKGGNDAQIASLLQRMGLGGVFQDANAARFALTSVNNKAEHRQMAATDGTGALDDLVARRMQSPGEQFKKLRLNVSGLGEDIGDVLLPEMLKLADVLQPVVTRVREFAQANPGLIKGLVRLAAVTAAFKLAVPGLALGFSFLVRTPLAQLRTGVARTRAGWALLRGQMTLMVPLLKRGAMLASGLGKVLAGKLLSGLSLAAKAISFLGRALLMNPIGLLITGIGIAAYLIYKHWEPISEFFSGLWDSVRETFDGAWERLTKIVDGLWTEVETAFDGGLAGVGALILDWSPLGLFYSAFAGVMSYFGIELPGKFSDFGTMLVQGLVDGIADMGSTVRDTIVGIGEDAVGWFKQTLGINSPSKVFMELGAGVPEGAAKGIDGSTGMVRDAALGMAAAAAVTLASPAFAMDGLSLPAPPPLSIPAPPSTAPGAVGGHGAMTVTFAPNIQVTMSGGDANNVREQVRLGLQSSYAEFERLMQQYEARRSRRAYGDI